MAIANTVFTRHYNSVDSVLNFDAAWKNGTGYLDGAVTDELGLMVGQSARFVDDFGRRCIATCTQYGNVVAFERFIANESQQDVVVVYNAPHELGWIFGSHIDTEEKLGLISGWLGMTVGDHLTKLVK